MNWHLDGAPKWTSARLPHETVCDAIRHWGEAQPDSIAARFLAAGTVREELTANELNARADRLAWFLAARFSTQSRALLLFKPGLDFIVAFVGCLRAGVIAVPAPLPGPREGTWRVESILEDCAPSLILTHADALPTVDRCKIALPIIDINGIDGTNADEFCQFGTPRSDDLAFLQYTSGSTSAPKGVIVSHRNLVSNVQTLIERFDIASTKSIVSWLPHYHDMGLVGPILTCLVAGRPVVLMSPADFLRNPMVWLKCISRYDSGVITAPTFAYDLCARMLERASNIRTKEVDLSCVQTAIVGAEAVREASLARFAVATSRFGFSSKAFYPSYGLAEATLFVDGIRGPLARIARCFDGPALAEGRVVPAPTENAGSRSVALVPSGSPLNESDTKVIIVDEKNQTAAAPSLVGEICISGPSVTAGYWGHAEANRAVFRIRTDQNKDSTFLKTGDLGFIHDGQLFVVGRKDDLIILNGVNYYPDDIEAHAISAHALTHGLKAAAICVETKSGARLVVFQERRRRSGASEDASIVAAIRQSVRDRCNITVHGVTLVPPGKLPTTSSGKIKRRRCREMFDLNEIPPTWSTFVDEGRHIDASSGKDETFGGETAAERIEMLRSIISNVLAWPTSHIDSQLPVSAYPLDSLKLVEIVLTIEAKMSRSITVEQLLEAPSLSQVAENWGQTFRPDARGFWADAALPGDLQPQSTVSNSGDGDVVLTGATGLLGGHLIAKLLSRSDRLIRCLVRGSASNARAKLISALDGLGADVIALERKVLFHSVDLADPTLGLTSAEYLALAENASVVIHCAAELDFVRPYSGLRRTNVEGTRAILTLGTTGRAKRLLHVSSVSVVQAPLQGFRRIAEDDALDYPELLLNGYAQTKWVSDVMVTHAKNRGFDVNIFRIPWLLEMPIEGRPLYDGFLLRLFHSCGCLGYLPDTALSFDIVPVDFVADAIAGTALAPESGGCIHHLGLDRALGVADVQRIMKEQYGNVPLEPVERWIERLTGDLRRDKNHPLAPLSPLFLRMGASVPSILPYLQGDVSEMDSTATRERLARSESIKVPNADDARHLLAAALSRYARDNGDQPLASWGRHAANDIR